MLLREGLKTGYNFEAMNPRKEKSINIDEFLINKIFYIYIYISRGLMLLSDTFVELLSFRLPPHQSLYLCKTFNSLNVLMK